MTKTTNAGLAALLVALVTGGWASLKGCAADAPSADAGAVLVDAGAPLPEPEPEPLPVDAGPAPSTDGGIVTAPSSGQRWVSAYYAAWFPDMLPHDRIDMASLTHLFVGRAAPTATGGVVQMLDADPARGRARALDLCQRAHAAQRKCVLMLGGEGDGPAYRSASSAATRATFVANLLAFLDAMQADGVDLDWEEDVDYQAFLELARALRAARPGMVLTIPLFPVNTNFGLDGPVAAFVAAVHPYVDQLNAMTYGIGMAGPWGGWVTWHTGALHGAAGNRPTSVSSTLEAYAAAGVPKAKLGMGIGFFGIDYRYNTAPRQPLGSGPNDFGSDDLEYRYSRVVGYFAGIGSAGQRLWDDEAKMPYLSFPGGYSPGAGYSRAGFLSYEDERSIAEKGAWLRREGYGGTILWVINYSCIDPKTGENPLLDATRKAFLQ